MLIRVYPTDITHLSPKFFENVSFRRHKTIAENMFNISKQSTVKHGMRDAILHDYGIPGKIVVRSKVIRKLPCFFVALECFRDFSSIGRIRTI